MVGRERIGGQTWVVGVDGSENSVQALKWAVRHAPTRASTLRVIRAWSVPTTGGLEMMPATIDDFRPVTAYELLDEVIAEVEWHDCVVVRDDQLGAGFDEVAVSLEDEIRSLDEGESRPFGLAKRRADSSKLFTHSSVND